MVVNPWKAFLFLAGGTVAAGGTAYVSGALDPYLYTRPAHLTAVPQPDAGAEPVATPEAPATPAKPPEKQMRAIKGSVVPAFDVVRVEPDGSLVVAGKAEPETSVEMLVGEQVIGTAEADGSGDFAIVLDKPLKPGDYQLTLRSTAPGAAAAVASAETAVVSIPETPSGQVLAMVETPGKASEMVTTPAPRATAEPVKPAEPSKPEVPVDSSQAARPSEPPAPQQAAAPSDAAATEQAPAPAVAVQAVEIEGRKIFIAGTAEPGRIVRIYANETMLGEAKTSPKGRFLVEAERELPVGNYTIRADVLGDDGLQVIARAAVPFEREPGEAIAAVAPREPASARADRPTQAAAQGQDPDAAPKAARPAQEAPSSDMATVPSEQAIVPPAATAPKLEAVASAVIIRRGDSLWRISRRVYGRGIRYSTIYLANQDQITNPNRIWPGQVFSVPERTEEGEAANMKAMGDQMTAKPASAAQ